MMLETKEYRWKASECRRKAEEARHLVDKHAWLELAADWSKLARAKELKRQWRALCDRAAN